MRPSFVFAALVALLLTCSGQIRKYKACESAPGPEKRDLFVATCDSRSGWKEFMATKTWNVTGYPLREGSAGSGALSMQSSIPMTNVCKDQRWEGFLTKPLLYLGWLKNLELKNERGGDNHVILMDSDTFWSSDDIKSIWNKYDCARNKKDVVRALYQRIDIAYESLLFFYQTL